MKANKIILIIIIITFVQIDNVTAKDRINRYFYKPLFNFSIEKNILPYGNFRLLRSYQHVTQILESIDNNIILHIDRNNNKSSKIFSKAYSPFHNVFLETKEISQDEFNLRVEHLIRNGDMRERSTHRYGGLEKFCNFVSKQASKIKKDGIFYRVKLGNNSLQTKLKINVFHKNLFISNIMNDEVNRNFILYSVYVENSYDSNILKIIREYIAKLYDMRNSK